MYMYVYTNQRKLVAIQWFVLVVHTYFVNAYTFSVSSLCTPCQPVLIVGEYTYTYVPPIRNKYRYGFEVRTYVRTVETR